MTQPYGTFALSPLRETVRRLASSTPSGKPGMWMISVLRKLALMGHERGTTGPHDVEVAQGVQARLFPASNRCEKRAFAGVHIWDPKERSLLDERIKNHSYRDPFVFLDVGANVGLYSLFVNASGKANGKAVKIIAVEPDVENRTRLKFNCDASQCDAIIEPIGIADEAGTGVLTDAGPNRGGITVMDSGEGETITLETLAGLFARHALTRIDAMKVDIEGRDDAALRAMVKQAPKAQWPKIIIVETGRNSDSPIVTHLMNEGYSLVERTGINAILKFDSAADPSADHA